MSACNSPHLRLRPHHIYCLRFLEVDFPERGSEFQEVENKIKQVMTSGSDMKVEAIEGVDEVCRACSNCVEDRCVSPNEDEAAVRKWDAIILKELGLSLGSALTVKEWQDLIAGKSPLALCQRCRWREYCQVG